MIHPVLHSVTYLYSVLIFLIIAITIFHGKTVKECQNVRMLELHKHQTYLKFVYFYPFYITIAKVGFAEVLFVVEILPILFYQ